MAVQENYDESLVMCEKINKIIPTVCENIKEMQKLDKNFSYDLNLKIAEEYLASLDTIRPPANIESEKMTYVNEFRDHLTLGLNSLSEFFDRIGTFKSLTDEQRTRLSAISAKIVITQDSIIKIVSN